MPRVSSGPGEAVAAPDPGSALATMLGASALTTLGAIPPFLLGAQAVLMRRDLDFGAAGLGAAVSAFFAVAALVTIGAGGAFERWSRRRGLLLAGTLVAAGGLGMALLAEGWVALMLLMALLGAANAACQGSSNATVSTALPPHRRGLGFGIKQSAVPAAIMFGGLAVPTTTALLGWRSTFLTTGVLGLVVVVAALLPDRSRRRPVRARRLRSGERAPRGPLLVAGASITFASAAANFLGAYLASWAHGIGLTVGQAGLLMAAGSASSIVVRIVSGHRADRRHGGNLSLVAVQMFVGGACLALIALLPFAWSVVLFGFVAFALGWSWPGLLLYAVARVGRDAPGQASSVVQAGAFTGGALGPVLFGLVVGEVGFVAAWFTASASFLVAGVLALAARTGFRRDLRRRPPTTPFGYGGGRDRPRYTAGPRPAAEGGA
ncbi:MULTISPECIES: MFS transporter [unclassified Ornithinimicrobium]|uniref:MFS transporter n=1 Tax=unclassified Ornithinimicrobium TaxID=2615080 RepID=UPI003852B5ED